MPLATSMSGLEVEACTRCDKPAVVHQLYSGIHLCASHLRTSIRKRVSKALREQVKLPKDAIRETGEPKRILVGISGGKDSSVLLEMMVELLGPRRDVEIIAGCVDEGIDGYRAPSLECAERLAERFGVRLEHISYPELGFERMDEVVLRMPIIEQNIPEAKGMMPCSYCGVFRRQGLNALAERVGADWMALGHNLDDMAQSILMNLQNGDVERTIRLAPHTWDPIEGLVPRIVPLRWIPEQEIHAHALEAGLEFHHGDCPYAPGAFRQRSRALVATMESETPGARHGLLHSMEKMRELQMAANDGETLSESWAEDGMQRCERCGEVSSREICQACTMRDWISSSSG